jgi:vacuolar protein sorting-associated protein 41
LKLSRCERIWPNVRIILIYCSLRTDCIISGVSLYTPNLLLVLAYIESEGNTNNHTTPDTPTRKGRHHRQNALEPELRLIDLTTQEEVSNDTLSISRFESLSASDYHLSVLPPIKITPDLIQQGGLGVIGSGLGTIGSGLYAGVGTVSSGLYTGVETVGQGVWDATTYPTRMLGANRLFSSAGSMRSGSGKVAEEKAGSGKGSRYLSGWIPGFSLPGFGTQSKEATDVGATLGMKIFICSPYDCVAAVRRNLADKLQWLTKMERYDDAWHLLDQYPEAVGTISETSEASSPPTPSKTSSITTGPIQQRVSTGLADFFADASSIASTAKAKGFNSAAEKEKRRIGELWLQQLSSREDWGAAGEVAGKVLGTTSRLEHWIWLFIRNNKFDEIAYVVPTLEITPPLPSLIYEIILGHYVSSDRARFQQLLDLWPSDLFDIGSIIAAIEDQINGNTAPKESTDWRILQECLAKLFLASGRYDDAVRAYIRLQDADTALSMIKEHHLLDAVAENIPELVLLRISPEQLRTASNETLEELSSEPIKLLVDEATTGVVQPERVVVQLEESSLLIFLYFYLRALWRGEGTEPKIVSKHRFGHINASANLAADEGKILVEQFADTAVELFAEFDRELLMEFLHTSTAYTFDKAVQVCEHRHFIPELVYLLSKTGQTRKALFLIIDELKDVVQAISFVKEQKDDDLWEDLLDYSMSRPKFISGLLAEVGTAINPITLVRRIPSGLEIEGLKDGLKKMIREYDLQDSISTGVAKVLQGEVAVGMEKLRKGRRKGIKFDVTAGGKVQPSVTPVLCSGCGKAFMEEETETLVGFACGHTYHLSHLLHDPESSQPLSPSPEGARHAADEYDASSPTFARTVGPKVTNARLLRYMIEAVGGCRICKARKAKEAEV